MTPDTEKAAGGREPVGYVGFKKHRLGYIHLFCPQCGRKMSNVPRWEHDPPQAVLAHIPCEECSQGCKVEGASAYLDANGRFLEWDDEKGRYV